MTNIEKADRVCVRCGKAGHLSHSCEPEAGAAPAADPYWTVKAIWWESLAASQRRDAEASQQRADYCRDMAARGSPPPAGEE